MPSSFPFQLSANTTSFSLTTLPDDHVVSCYISDGVLWYKESHTRGFIWYEPEPLIGTNLTGASNLVVRSVRQGTSTVLLASWDALVEPSNASSRRAFFATIELSSPRQVTGPMLAAGDASPPARETYPSVAGDDASGYCLAWVRNTSGSDEIVLRSGPGLASLTDIYVISHADGSTVRSLFIVDEPFKGLGIVYQKTNATHDEMVYRPISLDSGPGSPSTVLDFSSATGVIISIDVSIATMGNKVVSFQEIGFMNDSVPINVSRVAWMPMQDANGTCAGTCVVKNSTLASNDAVYLQHVIFSNDQVLTVWLERDGTGGAFSIMYSIIDFDMTNRNSIYHSILLSYVFAAAGIFNLAIHKLLKRRAQVGMDAADAEPWNNIFISIIFFTLSGLMLLPFSGFQGESLGNSFADGFIYPAPINLASLIVIGFVFLFYLVSTPVIDHFWRRDFRTRKDTTLFDDETRPYTWKQEFMRKIPHLVTAIFIAGFDPVGAAAMRFADINKYNLYNFVNEGAIIFDYALRLNNIEVGSYAVKIVMTSGAIFLWVLDLHMLLAPNRYFFMKDYLNYISRRKEKTSMADFVVMIISLLVMIILLTYNPAYKLQGHMVSMAGFCSLCFGDTMGVVVGKSFGKHPLIGNKKKTWEGAIAGMVTSFGLSLIFLSWPFALLVAAVYLLVDLITPRLPISDNIMIPLLLAVVFLPLLPFVDSFLMQLYL